MKRFLARFRFAWKAAIAPDYVLDADKPDFWTREDAMGLLGYLRSESGRKLKLILQNYILKSAYDEVRKVRTPGHAVGVACVVSLIDSYFTGLDEPETAPEPEQTAAEMDFARGLGV